ncbi:MAG: hypothetical protein HC836_35595 [Richelia sp. RM2_1_2]|nr:hypothetical protein [Richelia sp. RM2_1_2]
MSNIVNLDEYRIRRQANTEITDEFRSETHSQTESLVNEVLLSLESVMVRECLSSNHPNCIIIRSLLEEMIDLKLKIRDDELASDLEMLIVDDYFNSDDYIDFVDNLLNSPDDRWFDFNGNPHDDKK